MNGRELTKRKHKNIITRNANKIIVVALIIITLGISTMLAWALQDDNVLDIKTLPIPSRIIQDDETGNGVMILDVDFCKNIKVDGNIRVSFVSASTEVFLPTSPERFADGCSRAEFPVIIPKGLPADTYSIRIHAVYDINPLKQSVVEEFKSTPVYIDQKNKINKI